MATIDKTQALRRTKLMLVRVWKLAEEPVSDKSLRAAPPRGLGKNDNQIRALEGPIERVDFRDVNADVIGDDLIKAKTVAELRNRIWEGIPPSNQS